MVGGWHWCDPARPGCGQGALAEVHRAELLELIGSLQQQQHTGQVPHLAPLCIPWALSPSPTVLAQPRRASHRAWHSSDTLLEGGTRAVRALRGTIVGAVGSMLAAVAQRQAGARLAVQAKLGRGWATVLSKVLCAVH